MGFIDRDINYGGRRRPEDVLSELQRMNEDARVEDAERALNVLNGPKRSGIQQGFARGNGNTVYMGAGLDAVVREQQQRQNKLLGSALALSNMQGKTTMKMSNEPPSNVNGIGAGGQRGGSAGGDSGVYENHMRNTAGDSNQALMDAAKAAARAKRGIDTDSAAHAPGQFRAPESSPARKAEPAPRKEEPAQMGSPEEDDNYKRNRELNLAVIEMARRDREERERWAR